MKKNNFKSLMQAAVLICTPLVIASCDDVFGDADNPISSHISIKEAAVELVLHADKPDSVYTRTAIAATGAVIEYSSSNEKIAKVDAKTGKITGVGEGTCKIIAKATGKDSRGNMTYQEDEVSFPVIVKDYRARVDLIEGAEIPVYNSADANLTQLDMSKIVKAWPADVTLTYEVTNPTAPAAPVVSTADLSKIVLTGNSGTAKVKATIASTLDLGDYERKSFKDNQKSEEFEITVKEGVAYIAGYELKNNVVTPVRKTMFKDYNNEKYTLLSEAVAAQPSGDLTLKAGWYVVDPLATSINRNIRVTGDVNLIMSNPLNMNGNIILDQSAEKSYELNIIRDYDNQYNNVWNINKIQDFKKVAIDQNVSFNTADPNFKNIGTLNILSSYIDGWKFENIGTLDIANANLDGSTNPVSFKTVESLSISKSRLWKVSFNTVTALNIANATQLDWASFAGVNSLNITNNAVLNVNNPTFTTIGTLNASKVNFVGTTTFNKTIGTLGLTNATLTSTFGTGDNAVTFGAINLKTSNMTCAQVVLKDGGAITLDGGTFAATATGDNYAVKGNVVVNKGTFTASSPDFHAVKGNLTGTTFYETNVSATAPATAWSAITGTTSQEPFVKGEKE